MITVDSWFIKIDKAGKPVVYITCNNSNTLKKLLPTNEDIHITQEGLIIQYKDKDYNCNFDAIVYPNVPTSISWFKDNMGISIDQDNILVMFYDVFSSALIDKSPFIVKKTPFNLQKILNKYEDKFAEKMSGIDFDLIICSLSKNMG